jgi:hypothetical protein
MFLLTCGFFFTQRITLPSVVLEEKTSVKDIVTLEQQTQIDAITVRLLKTRKVMLWKDLTMNIMSSCLLFRPDTRIIKQRVEDLIRRGFIRRDGEDMRNPEYVYVPGDAAE